jgi:hypothetical protein
MKPCIKLNTEKHRCLFDLYFGYRGSAFQPYWRTNHDDS